MALISWILNVAVDMRRPLTGFSRCRQPVHTPPPDVVGYATLRGVGVEVRRPPSGSVRPALPVFSFIACDPVAPGLSSITVLRLMLIAAGVALGLGCRPQTLPDSADATGPGDTNLVAATDETSTLETGLVFGAEMASGGADAEVAAALGALTQAVRRYGLEQRQAPRSLEDLVARGYLEHLPEAPKGQRFVISKDLRVYLDGP
jgi:hypothetical protein